MAWDASDAKWEEVQELQAQLDDAAFCAFPPEPWALRRGPPDRRARQRQCTAAP
jgi:hypothetical protein